MENEGDENWVTASTFWLPMGATPRCALEQLAGDLFNWHVERLGLLHSEFLDPDSAGSEWWVVWLDGQQDDVDWHWDVDGGLRRLGEIRHPYLSTVTYIESGGSLAPTAVVESCRKERVLSSRGVVPVERVHLSSPVNGKHVCYDGRLLHAAPAELQTVFSKAQVNGSSSQAEGVAQARVTFLVNIWLSCGPDDAQLLPDDLASQLTPNLITSLVASGSCESTPLEDLTLNQSASTKDITWHFEEDTCLTHEMAITLPVPCGHGSQSDCLTLCYEDGLHGEVSTLSEWQYNNGIQVLDEPAEQPAEH